jgi:putative PIN family toxin of toxin-antitoxin system
MRLVLDTNVVIAGLLWHGTPRRLLDRVIDNDTIELYSSPALIDELGIALAYPKFTQRIARFETTVEALVAQYRALLILVSPIHTPRVVARDPDDDEVLALAIAAQVDLVVSGDDDLLSLKTFRNTPIVTAAEAVNRIAQSSSR